MGGQVGRQAGKGRLDESADIHLSLGGLMGCQRACRREYVVLGSSLESAVAWCVILGKSLPVSYPWLPGKLNG